MENSVYVYFPHVADKYEQTLMSGIVKPTVEYTSHIHSGFFWATAPFVMRQMRKRERDGP